MNYKYNDAALFELKKVEWRELISQKYFSYLGYTAIIFVFHFMFLLFQFNYFLSYDLQFTQLIFILNTVLLS